MSTAVQIVTKAYRKHNLDEVTSFATTQEFPYNLAEEVINDVIKAMNRLGAYWFCETNTTLTYGVGTYTYTISSTTYPIDPTKIIRVRRTASGYQGRLYPLDWGVFEERYRNSSVQTRKPQYYSVFGTTLEFDSIPDQDYTIKVSHFKDMPTITATGDTFLVPEADEDVLIDNAYAVVGFVIGRWDYQTMEGMIANNTRHLLADMKKYRDKPTQMPAAF